MDKKSGMMKVLKFGGTSVGSAAHMRRVADILVREGAGVVVLSAMSGTTDALQRIASFASAGGCDREVALLLAGLKRKYMRCVEELLVGRREEASRAVECALARVASQAASYAGEVSQRVIIAQGELLTTALFTLYLRERGCRAELLHAPAFVHGGEEARVDAVRLRSLAEVVADGGYAVTQGFICSGPDGMIDNLGRGGSDYSAALIGAALGADEVQIWTDIDGMHNNDPRFVPDTAPVHELHFEEAAELAYFGAKILHPSCVLPAKLHNIPVRLLNTMEPQAKGTLIFNAPPTGRIKAVAAKDNITAIKIKSGRMLLAYGFLHKVFETFENHRTAIDMMATSEVGVSVTVDNDARLEAIVDDLKEFATVTVDRDMVIIAVVGDLEWHNRGFETAVLGALSDIPVRMVSYGGSDYNISVLVRSCDKVKALKALSQHLFSNQEGA